MVENVVERSGQPMLYTLRSASLDDFEFIHALRISGLRDNVDQIWGWDDADQLARFQRSFDPKQYQVLVAGGHDVGAVAIDWMEDEAFLADLEIMPEWRGRGLGTAVLRALIAEAAARRLPVALQVLKGNPARRLYERLGFLYIAETDTHHHMRTVPPAAASRSQ